MGLSIQVGLLADLLENDAEGAEWLREGLAEVNRLLVANGLPPHHEPEALAPLSSRSPTDGFPYSCLHYLRRAYAHCVADPKRPATPLPDSERASHDPVVEAQPDRAGRDRVTLPDAGEQRHLPVARVGESQVVRPEFRERGPQPVARPERDVVLGVAQPR